MIRQIDDLFGKYSAIVPESFITHRDVMKHRLKHGIRGANCEFPEHHQCSLREQNQSHAERHEKRYDTIFLPTNETLDYKQYSAAGIYISDFCRENMRSGITQKLVIWKWLPYNQAPTLTAGCQIGYEILGSVDWEYVEANMFRVGPNPKDPHRFTYQPIS